MVSNRIYPQAVVLSKANSITVARKENEAAVSFSSELKHADSRHSSQPNAMKQAVLNAAKLDKNIPTGLRALLRSACTINLCLVLLLVLVPALAISITSAIGFGASTMSQVKKVKDSLYTNIAQQVEAGLDGTTEFVLSLATVFQAGLISTTNNTAIDMLLVKQANLFTFSPVNAVGMVDIYIMLPNGVMRGVMADPDRPGKFLLFYCDPVHRPNELVYVPIDLETGHLDVAAETPFVYDLSTAVYFVAGMELQNDTSKPKSGWSPSYADSGSLGQMFSSAIAPVYGSNNQIALLAAADRSSASISKILKDIVQSEPGSAAIVIEHNAGNGNLPGWLVASSTDNPVITADAHHHITRYTATQLTADPLVHTVGLYLDEAYGTDLEGLDHSIIDSLYMKCNGETYVLVIGSISRPGLIWVVVLAIPLLNFTSDVLIVSLVAATIVIVSLLFAVAAAIVYAHKMLQPLTKMIAQFELVEALQLEKIEATSPKYSYLLEIATMQSYFLRMVDRMKLYRSFLPQNLLDAIEGSRRECEDSPAAQSPVERQSSLATQPSKKYAISNRRYSSDSSKDSESERSISSQSEDRPQPLIAFRMDLGLEQTEVTLCCISLNNIQKYLAASPQDAVGLYGEVLDVVSRVARTCRGNVVSFNVHKITIFWNANNVQRTRKKAAIFCIGVEQAINRINTRNAMSASIRVEYDVALVHGQMMVGNIGNEMHRQFTVIGELTQRAEQLSLLCKLYGCRALMDSLIREAIRDDYTTRSIPDLSGWVTRSIASKLCEEQTHRTTENLEELLGDFVQLAAASLDSLRTAPMVYELGSSRKLQDDEWMYEMHAEQNDNKWQFWEEAVCRLMNDGDLQTALLMLVKHLNLEQHDTDRAGHLLRLILKSLL